MDVGTPTALLDAPLTVGQPLALLLVSLMLALLGLNLWLLVDRARRRRAERELFARLVVLETDRARAQMAAAGGPAAPRGRGLRRRETGGQASGQQGRNPRGHA